MEGVRQEGEQEPSETRSGRGAPSIAPCAVPEVGSAGSWLVSLHTGPYFYLNLLENHVCSTEILASPWDQPADTSELFREMS